MVDEMVVLMVGRRGWRVYWLVALRDRLMVYQRVDGMAALMADQWE